MRPIIVCLLVFNTVADMAANVLAEAPPPNSTARQRFNQVFVKVVVPVTSHTPKQDGPSVESWIAEQLKQMGEFEYFAVTDWVPVCDELLADDIVTNNVWDGRLKDKHRFCPVGADIPERENGRLLVSIGGWLPFGVAVNIRLPDEPGSRSVKPVQILAGNEPATVKADERLPFVAVMIAPPPQSRTNSQRKAR